MMLIQHRVDRAVILRLAEFAGQCGNGPLRDLLLVVAGRLEEDGTVRYTPDVTDEEKGWRWLNGAGGKGHALALKRDGRL